jgi:hypothetical protein
MKIISEPINKFVKILLCLCIISVIIYFILTFNPHQMQLDRFYSVVNYSVSIDRKNCTVIIHKPLGRLGNHLFQFASAYGLSLEHSCDLYIGPNLFRELSQYFEIDLPNLLATSALNKIPSVQQIDNHCTYFKELFQANTSQHIELVGYWQAYKHKASITIQTDYFESSKLFYSNAY